MIVDYKLTDLLEDDMKYDDFDEYKGDYFLKIIIKDALSSVSL